MPLHEQVHRARECWEQFKQTLSNFQRCKSALTKQIQDLHTRRVEFTMGEMNAEEGVACEKAELEALVELCLGIRERKGRSQQGPLVMAEVSTALRAMTVGKQVPLTHILQRLQKHTGAVYIGK